MLDIKSLRTLHGRKAEILDAFLFGATDVGTARVSGRLGRHTVLWGESLFFGNNAIAGAFNIVTKKPGDKFDASVRALYSPEAREYAIEAAGGGPINDTVAIRAAATAERQSDQCCGSTLSARPWRRWACPPHELWLP